MYFDKEKNKNPFVPGFLANYSIEKCLKKGVICLIRAVNINLRVDDIVFLERSCLLVIGSSSQDRCLAILSVKPLLFSG
jgi:predicted Kef-type K+ transport protein